MGPPDDALAASDDSFYFLLFGFVTSLLVLAWAPLIFGFIWDLRSFNKFLANCAAFWAWLTFLPRIFLLFALRPGLITHGLKALLDRKGFTVKVVGPLALRKTIRIKVILLILFFFLLSIVLYQKLSFDPHEILGVSKDAEEKHIRKNYRKLSMINHPDKNKTEEARVKYIQIKKAYKMLADPESYEEELANQPQGSGEVSVALPRFLLDPKYRKIAAPLLLGTLFMFPILLIWMLRGDDSDEVIRDVVDRLKVMQEDYDYFYRMMGEPEGCTDGRPDDVCAAWQINPNAMEVSNAMINLLNDDMQKKLQQIFGIIRTNRHYITNFQQFSALHRSKQELLLQIGHGMAFGEKPKKQMVANLQAANKRIIGTLEALQGSDAKLASEGGGFDSDSTPSNRKELRSRKGR